MTEAGTVAEVTVEHLDREVDAILATDSLTGDLWDDVAARLPDAPPIVELLAAVRAADGGKLLRPRLAAAAYVAFGGSDRELIRVVAGAQQLLHIGLCAHDDVIDDDLVRHGRPTALALGRQSAHRTGAADAQVHRRGEAAAILAGDLAINTAVAALISTPCPPTVQLRLARAALSAVESAIFGEALDVWSECTPPASTDPLLTASLKTASYSVVLPLSLGAIAADAHPRALAAIRDVGTPLGIAYQLHDDDLGLFGDPERTGKSTLSDLRDGKRTEHLRLAFSRADAGQRAILDSLVGREDLSDADASRVRGIIVDTGARAHVAETIDRLLARGREIARLDLPECLSEYLAVLTDRLRERDR